MFDGHLLDIFEFGIETNSSIHEFVGQKKGVGNKPVMVFLGDQWQNDSIFQNIQNMLVDLFRGVKTTEIALEGLDHSIVCTCLDGKIYIRTNVLNFKKTEGKVFI